MANCPKCGSFVREGEECRFCNGGYGSHPKDEISVKIDNLLNSIIIKAFQMEINMLKLKTVLIKENMRLLLITVMITLIIMVINHRYYF